MTVALDGVEIRVPLPPEVVRRGFDTGSRVLLVWAVILAAESLDRALEDGMLIFSRQEWLNSIRSQLPKRFGGAEDDVNRELMVSITEEDIARLFGPELIPCLKDSLATWEPVRDLRQSFLF